MTDAGPILLVPDLHQDIEFLTKIHEAIQKESPKRVIFLGDYFDPYYFELEEEEVLRKYCRLLKALAEGLDERATFLWGNHDLPYYLAQRYIRGRNPLFPREFVELALQFTWDKAQIIDEELGVPFWERLEIVTEAHGYLLSHAGLHPYWLQGWKLKAVPLQIRFRWKALIKNFETNYQGKMRWLADAGLARGGSARIGGPIWLDWEREFEDIPCLPQIVGHTRGEKLRRNGESFCIDCCQSAYAMLEPGGPMMIHV